MMRLLLWCTVFVILAQVAQGGIFRRYSRRPRLRPSPNARIGAPDARSLTRYRPWSSLFFRRQRSPWIINRNARKFTFHSRRQQHHLPHYHRQSSLLHHVILPMLPQLPTTTLSSWRPLDYGNPIDRDPTFDYAPPAIERVRFVNEGRSGGRRRSGPPPMPASPRIEHGKPRPPGWNKRRPTRPSLWKMLAAKQRPSLFRRPRPRPQPGRFHRFPHEAEVFPHIPNIVYFQPTDVITSPPTIPGPVMIIPSNYKHGSVVNTPLYAREPSASNEFKPIKVTENRFNIVGYSGPPSTTTRKPPTVLQPVKTTPVTISTTHNSVVKPFVPTNPTLEISQEDIDVQSLLENPPAPIPVFPNSFNILDSDYEGNDLEPSVSLVEKEEEKEVVKKPALEPIYEPSSTTESTEYVRFFSTTPKISVATSKSVSMSIREEKKAEPTKGTTSKTTTTSTTTTRRPTTASTTTTTTEKLTTTPTTSTTQRPFLSSTIFPKHPTMPTYKRKPTPVYARKGVSSKPAFSSSSSGSISSAVSSKEQSNGNGSGEIVVITAGRSKVKEYKPQFIANHTQLIAFDKVADTDSLGGDSDSVTSNLPSPSSTTTKSPLQEFDPMQLLHSWFTKP